MNLVHEAMAREAAHDKKPKKEKKEKKKNARTRFIATLLTWVLLNLIWMHFSHAIAWSEVNKHDRNIDPEYDLNVPNMFNLDRVTPVDLTCDFKPKNATVPIVTVRIYLDGEGILWSGNSTDDCAVEQLKLAPGEYTFQTIVIDSNNEELTNRSNYISSEMDLGIHIWEPFRMEGFVVANALGLFLGLADRAIRGILRRRKEALVRNMPLHKRRQKEEWEQLAHSMSGGSPVDVDDLVGFQLQDENESAEMQRRKMRESFAAQSAEADGDTEAFVDEDAVDQDDELGPGTTEGLTGKVEQDRNIRTVSDLWRQLSGDDPKKKKE
ncbi:MAG: hypothetical protein VYA86_07395 [Candidatus Thermoplasmatota archaeon]|nr:hypothetical protein [Candidatus Thermoplasmatota archaeon]